MGSGVSRNLSTNSSIEGFHQLHPKVIPGSGLAGLFQDGVELRVVHRVAPTSAPSRRLQPEGKERPEGTPQLFGTIQSPDHSMFPIEIFIRKIVKALRLSYHGLLKFVIAVKRLFLVISLHGGSGGSGERMT